MYIIDQHLGFLMESCHFILSVIKGKNTILRTEEQTYWVACVMSPGPTSARLSLGKPGCCPHKSVLATMMMPTFVENVLRRTELNIQACFCSFGLGYLLTHRLACSSWCIYRTALPLQRFQRHTVPVLQNVQTSPCLLSPYCSWCYWCWSLRTSILSFHASRLKGQIGSIWFSSPRPSSFCILFLMSCGHFMYFWLWLKVYRHSQGCSWFRLTNMCIVFYRE